MTSAGFSLNIITMSGLVLGVGMMVDNSIVVLESCFRAIETEEDKGLLGYARASLSGTNIVLQSILGSTVTTCVVFLPLVFLQGMSGQMFGSMGYVIVFCMLASFLSAITIVPLTYMAYKPQERMQAPMSRPMERIQNGYRRIMPGLLNHKAIIMIASVILVIAAYFLASGMETELMTADIRERSAFPSKQGRGCCRKMPTPCCCRQRRLSRGIRMWNPTCCAITMTAVP